jgi:hypothetical protein
MDREQMSRIGKKIDKGNAKNFGENPWPGCI